MAGTHQIPAGILDAAHQVAEALIRDARHEREGQLAGGKQANQPRRVSAVGLHPVARSPGNGPRCRNANIDPMLPCQPRQTKPGRARLIDRTYLRAETLEERQHLLGRNPQLAHAHLARVGNEHRSMRLARVHVETDESPSLHRHGRFLLFGCGRHAGTSRVAIETPHTRVGDRPWLSTAPDVNPHTV